LLHARFGLFSGITASFDSSEDDGTRNAGFGLQLIGSKGTVVIQADRDPLAEWEREPNPEGKSPKAVLVAPGKFPIAVAIPGKPGFYFNPFTGAQVDLRAIPPGTLVRDPKDPDPAHKFRVP
jgi:hypothetical protein